MHAPNTSALNVIKATGTQSMVKNFLAVTKPGPSGGCGSQNAAAAASMFSNIVEIDVDHTPLTP